MCKMLIYGRAMFSKDLLSRKVTFQNCSGTNDSIPNEFKPLHSLSERTLIV